YVSLVYRLNCVIISRLHLDPSIRVTLDLISRPHSTTTITYCRVFSFSSTAAVAQHFTCACKFTACQGKELSWGQPGQRCDGLQRHFRGRYSGAAVHTAMLACPRLRIFDPLPAPRSQRG